jgi:proteic killer suppression protein
VKMVECIGAHALDSRSGRSGAWTLNDCGVVSARGRSIRGIHRVALRKLRQVGSAVTLDDLRVPPGNRREALKGDRAGQYSMRINDQWRICFIWSEGGAYDVEIVDYH